MQPITLRVSEITIAADLFLPDVAAAPPPWPAVIILHGFAGNKASHTEFGEYLAAQGFAALALDQRGHGASGGLMDADVLDDIGAALSYLAARPDVDPGRIAIRGSSMGGNLAIHGAARYRQIAAAIAVCPAQETKLIPWVRSGRAATESAALGLSVRLDAPGLLRYLVAHNLGRAAAALSPRPLLLIQARGDETVPYRSTVVLYRQAREPKQLILQEGGDHRSAQHDPAVHALEVEWLSQVAGSR